MFEKEGKISRSIGFPALSKVCLYDVYILLQNTYIYNVLSHDISVCIKTTEMMHLTYETKQHAV